jgi:2,3-bisphosphoglycerate-independent phosphoglycerate mutase
MPTERQVVLIILDGWGYREDPKDNAIALANKPFFDRLWKTYPHTLLKASGHAVGLPDGQMGNSEVGHMTIGAGSVIDTDLVRIKKAIDSGEFDTNPAFVELFNHVKKHDSTLHVQGLIGTGGVHAHSDHLYAFLRSAKKAGIKKVAIHAFTDGRDTPPQSAGEFMHELEEKIEEIGIGFIATVSGRFYAMDRDSNWDRLSRVEQALFECKGNVCELKPSEKMAELYKKGVMDEHLEPMVCYGEDGKGCAIEDNDGVFFFNFRADRARMLTSKILERQTRQNICFVSLTEYDDTYCRDYKCLIAFPPAKIATTLAGEISKAGLTQAHIAETEKFPHATYFLNGGRQDPFPGERHIMLDSRKDVKTHDQAPRMRALGIADKAVEEIQNGTNFIFINFANPDMVGHTANVPAIVEAIEETDRQLARVITALDEKTSNTGRECIAFITADHGNAELNVDPITGDKHTAHTTNPVPAILTSHNHTLADDGGLADIAPTILKLLDVVPHGKMTGHSLV